MGIMGNDIKNGLLLIVLATAIGSDLRCRKIPNWLTGSSVIAGLLLHTAMNHLAGFIFSLEGLVLGLGLFLVLYLVGWMGAGDVKLYAAVGSFLGPAQTMSAAIMITLVGGVLALVVLGFRLGWRKHRSWCLDHASAPVLTQSVRKIATMQGAAPKVPYAVAIGLGTLLAMVSAE